MHGVSLSVTAVRSNRIIVAIGEIVLAQGCATENTVIVIECLTGESTSVTIVALLSIISDTVTAVRLLVIEAIRLVQRAILVTGKSAIVVIEHLAGESTQVRSIALLSTISDTVATVRAGMGAIHEIQGAVAVTQQHTPVVVVEILAGLAVEVSAIALLVAIPDIVTTIDDRIDVTVRKTELTAQRTSERAVVEIESLTRQTVQIRAIAVFSAISDTVAAIFLDELATRHVERAIGIAEQRSGIVAESLTARAVEVETVTLFVTFLNTVTALHAVIVGDAIAVIIHAIAAKLRRSGMNQRVGIVAVITPGNRIVTVIVEIVIVYADFTLVGKAVAVVVLAVADFDRTRMGVGVVVVTIDIGRESIAVRVLERIAAGDFIGLAIAIIVFAVAHLGRAGVYGGIVIIAIDKTIPTVPVFVFGTVFICFAVTVVVFAIVTDLRRSGERMRIVVVAIDIGRVAVIVIVVEAPFVREPVAVVVHVVATDLGRVRMDIRIVVVTIDGDFIAVFVFVFDAVGFVGLAVAIVVHAIAADFVRAGVNQRIVVIAVDRRRVTVAILVELRRTILAAAALSERRLTNAIVIAGRDSVLRRTFHLDGDPKVITVIVGTCAVIYFSHYLAADALAVDAGGAGVAIGRGVALGNTEMPFGRTLRFRIARVDLVTGDADCFTRTGHRIGLAVVRCARLEGRAMHQLRIYCMIDVLVCTIGKK